MSPFDSFLPSSLPSAIFNSLCQSFQLLFSASLNISNFIFSVSFNHFNSPFFPSFNPSNQRFSTRVQRHTTTTRISLGVSRVLVNILESWQVYLQVWTGKDRQDYLRHNSLSVLSSKWEFGNATQQCRQTKLCVL